MQENSGFETIIQSDIDSKKELDTDEESKSAAEKYSRPTSEANTGLWGIFYSYIKKVLKHYHTLLQGLT